MLLKGPGTVIAAPDGRAYVTITGNPGLAQGGTGDVLTGLTAALVAQRTQLGDGEDLWTTVAIGGRLIGFP